MMLRTIFILSFVCAVALSQPVPDEEKAEADKPICKAEEKKPAGDKDAESQSASDKEKSESDEASKKPGKGDGESEGADKNSDKEGQSASDKEGSKKPGKNGSKKPSEQSGFDDDVDRDLTIGEIIDRFIGGAKLTVKEEKKSIRKTFGAIRNATRESIKAGLAGAHTGLDLLFIVPKFGKNVLIAGDIIKEDKERENQ